LASAAASASAFLRASSAAFASACNRAFSNAHHKQNYNFQLNLEYEAMF